MGDRNMGLSTSVKQRLESRTKKINLELDTTPVHHNNNLTTTYEERETTSLEPTSRRRTKEDILLLRKKMMASKVKVKKDNFVGDISKDESLKGKKDPAPELM